MNNGPDCLGPLLMPGHPGNAHPETDSFGPLPLPGQPTDALPGTERKILTLIERAQRKERLFHPLDGVKCPVYGLHLALTEESA
jgi:hypothetical protein